MAIPQRAQFMYLYDKLGHNDIELEGVKHM